MALKRITFLLVFLTLCLGYSQSDITYYESTDPLTDELSDMIVLVGMNRDSPPIYDSPMVIWQCKGEDGYSVAVQTHQFLGRDRTGVGYRFDDEEPRYGVWWLDTEGTAVIAQDFKEVEFTRRALESSQLVVVISNYRGTRRTFDFALDGLAESFERFPCRFAEELD